MSLLQPLSNAAPAFVPAPQKVGGVNVCRYGRSCHRGECWFAHPEGRDYDEGKSSKENGSVSNDGKEEDMDALLDEFEAQQLGDALNASSQCECCNGHSTSCETDACAARGGRCFCQNDTAEDNEEADDTWRDEWFPGSRTCTCCEGFIYRCAKKEPACQSGQCYCDMQTTQTGTQANGQITTA